MLILNNVSKSYGKKLAIDHINFSVNDGEIAILLGPNGAGKSTTIKCIAGLLKYSGGIEINGYQNKSIEAKREFSYISETSALYDMLTVYEHIEYIANAYSIKNYNENVEILLNRFDLWDKKDKLGKELSKGMQQKVSICCGLITNPKVILFDEPMMGLDPKAIKELKKVFVELKESGSSVIISTHIIDSVEQLWDKVLIMKDGNIVFARTKEELHANNEDLEKIFFSVTEE